MPPTAPMAAAIPQPSPSSVLTRIPSRAEVGLFAAPRMAKPTRVDRKKTKSNTRMTSVVIIIPA